MQWLRQKPTEDPAEFWQAVQQRRGGPVSWSSFATLQGRSGEGRVELTGLLYVVNGTAWFEDFEKDSWFGRLVGAGKNFQKTEITFALAEVVQVRMVSRSTAAACMAGAVPPDAVREAPRLVQWFSPPIVQVALADGSALFFDMLERASFLAILASERPAARPAGG